MFQKLTNTPTQQYNDFPAHYYVDDSTSTISSKTVRIIGTITYMGQRWRTSSLTKYKLTVQASGTHWKLTPRVHTKQTFGM